MAEKENIEHTKLQIAALNARDIGLSPICASRVSKLLRVGIPSSHACE